MTARLAAAVRFRAHLRPGFGGSEHDPTFVLTTIWASHGTPHGTFRVLSASRDLRPGPATSRLTGRRLGGTGIAAERTHEGPIVSRALQVHVRVPVTVWRVLSVTAPEQRA